MGQDRWKEIDDLFLQALDLGVGERAAFLDALGARDAEAHQSVEALLHAVEESEPFLATAVGEACAPPWSEVFAPAGEAGVPEPDDRSGELVGPYRLLRSLGRGGMATVYLAERADGLWKQEVAVKLIRHGLGHQDVVRRFVTERQILSSLRHPNIASLLDGGTMDDGLPYLVMEHVLGTPITVYCDDRRLSIDARLRLFCEVGRAVQHAHMSLVVHRDLKPSNILVTDQGRVKLLDFGIAKLLDPDFDPGSAHVTRPGQRPLTPQYASPEQFRGGRITTASDIYQLGGLLYRLLCGRSPRMDGRTGSDLGEARQAGTMPALPSRFLTGDPGRGTEAEVAATLAAQRNTTVERLSRKLRGDLDTIVTKCLRDDPGDRYSSATALVEDVERHLEAMPIRARAPSRRYRLRKYVKRNRWVAPVALAAVVGVGIYAFTVDRQARALERERNVARTETAKAEEVKQFLFGLFEAADPGLTGGRELTARELVDEGRRRIGDELEGQPAVRAEMLSALGDLYWRLDLAEPALDLSRQALDIRLTQFPEGSPEVAASLRQVSRMRSDPTFGTHDEDGSDAEVLLRRAIEATRAAHGPRHALYAQALHDWAFYGDHTPDRRVALEDSAIAILRAAPGAQRRLTEVLAEAARGNQSMARGLRLAEEALQMRLELFGERHGGVSASLSDLALLTEPSDPDSSIQLLHRALDIQLAITSPRHPQTLSIQNNLAGVLRDQGDFASAVPIYREVLALRRAETQNPVTQAYTKYGLAVSLVGLDRHEEAEGLLREVLVTFSPTDLRHNTARLQLARALAGQGRLDEAEAELTATLTAIDEGAEGPAEAVRETLAEIRDVRDQAPEPGSPQTQKPSERRSSQVEVRDDMLVAPTLARDYRNPIIVTRASPSPSFPPWLASTPIRRGTSLCGPTGSTSSCASSKGRRMATGCAARSRSAPTDCSSSRRARSTRRSGAWSGMG